eukprot:GAHX01003676.1.p1 GENE.GAHX01003676.1~~GAHX01003676.1.p1  ORF type:complete len:252 (+),score=26.72 GAHX01003676.1:80-757(+)
MDYYSKWPEVYGLEKISSSIIIERLKQTFMRFGYPNILVSDNGEQFISKETEEFLEKCGVKHSKVPLYNPRQNGLVERMNRCIGEKLDEADQFKWNIKDTLDEWIFNYRSTPHSTTGKSPFEVMFKRPVRDSLSRFKPEEEGEGIVDRDMVRRKQLKTKEYFDDKKCTKAREFLPGELVRIKDQRGRFSEPRKVIQAGKTSVTLENGKVYPHKDVWGGFPSRRGM